MNRLSKVLLIMVLLSLLATPVMAVGNPDTIYVDGYAETDVGVFEFWANEGPWGQDSHIYIKTPAGFSCDTSLYGVPWDVDTNALTGMRGNGVVDINLSLPNSYCRSHIGEPVPDPVIVDVIMTMNQVFHGSSHLNLVKGEGDSQNCQRWQGFDGTVTGTIAGSSISSTNWASFQEEECQITAKNK